MSFDYVIRRQGDTITVAPQGDIAMETVPVFRELLRAVVDNHENVRIDVDMRDVTFLDSYGIGLLIAAQRAAAARGTHLRLSAPGPVVRMVLQIAHLEEVLLENPAAS